MTRTLEQLLDVERPVRERRLRLALGDVERVGKLRRGLDPTHPATTTTGRGLEQDRIPGDLGRRDGLLHCGDRTVGSRQHRQACLLRRDLGVDLVTHPGHHIRRRAHER